MSEKYYEDEIYPLVIPMKFHSKQNIYVQT